MKAMVCTSTRRRGKVNTGAFLLRESRLRANNSSSANFPGCIQLNCKFSHTADVEAYLREVDRASVQNTGHPCHMWA